MKVLVWQWGRRGAGPRYAAELARALAREAGVEALLSLSTGAELLRTAAPPPCALPVRTYAGTAGFLARMFALPLAAPILARWLRRARIDIAICAMPAGMDLVMAAALRLARVPYVVVVHDADLHPGDRFPAQFRLQRWLVRGACGVVALSAHVAGRLREQGLPPGCALLRSALPPFHATTGRKPPRAHGGALRLLSFGRLLPYKGLDLLAEALSRLGPTDGLTVRVVGSGPETADLDRLRALPGVVVENRWVDEDEVAELFGWADAVILSHREASQSGIAAAALAARRWVVSTRVGGLAEQFAGDDGAVLCDPDPASLTAGIRILLARASEARAEVSPPPDRAWRDVVSALAADLRRLTAR